METIFDNTAHEKNDTSPVSLQLSILKDMLSYVHEHYPEKISLNDIANAGKISISSCNTIYKKYLKESPIKHLLNYRLMKSCELLIENALSVTEIAFDVGFANTSYYIDTFKKRYGCTPNEYRKRNNCRKYLLRTPTAFYNLLHPTRNPVRASVQNYYLVQHLYCPINKKSTPV